MFVKVFGRRVGLLLLIHYRSVRVGIWWVHGRCTHWVRNIRDGRLSNVKEISRIEVHVADAASCGVDRRRFGFNEGRRSAVVTRDLRRGLADSKQGSVDGSES